MKRVLIFLLYIGFLLSPPAVALQDNFNDCDITNWYVPPGLGSWGTSNTTSHDSPGTCYAKVQYGSSFAMEIQKNESGSNDGFFQGWMRDTGATYTQVYIWDRDVQNPNSGSPPYVQSTHIRGCGINAGQFVCYGFNGVSDYYPGYNPGANWVFFNVTLNPSKTLAHLKVYNASMGLQIDNLVSYSTLSSSVNSIMLYYASYSGIANFDDVKAMTGEPTGTDRIVFDAANYSLGLGARITYEVANPDFANHLYLSELTRPDNTKQTLIWGANGDNPGFFDVTMNQIGNWTAKLYECGIDGSGCYIHLPLASSTAQVYNANFTAIQNNIAANKSSYNRSETARLNYNISVNGRIQIYSPTTSYVYSVTAGANQHLDILLPEDAPFGEWMAFLQYDSNVPQDPALPWPIWATLDSTSFTVSNAGYNDIEFSEYTKIYRQGDTMHIDAISQTSGYVKLIDSRGILRLNSSISANTLTGYNYFIADTDPTGDWQTNLYNNTGAIVASDYADVYTRDNLQPTPTATPGPSPTPGTTIDYVGNPSLRKKQENNFLNVFYGSMTGLFSIAIMATFVFFMKKMKW